MLRISMGTLMTWIAAAALSACSASGGGNESEVNGSGGNGPGNGGSTGGPRPGPGVGGGIDVGGPPGGGMTGGPNGGAVRCDNKLTGVLRDFDPRTHPDFEPAPVAVPAPGMFLLPNRTKLAVEELGIVQPTLSPEFKPMYAQDPVNGSRTTYGQPWFDTWFKDTANLNGQEINRSMNYTIEFTDPDGDGVFTFDNGGKQFFPFDKLGFGNWPHYPPNDPNGGIHNYHFTYELHAKFIYRQGMKFIFSGDDDVWVFINGRLAVDIGGIHPRVERGVLLDTLQLTPNGEYQLDFFWAERQVSQSNFRIDTSMEFTDCNIQVPR